eukprot:TRINITY_DN27574_c0_g1_i1.p1 TRINITY_DN27574_c0_g1~~TRINITY_DN27574_c0_g1_i1.p1  ORF type:complete len:174 (-),score=26.65 TRINITY_DN27574_c0_g1_i1:132-653(-)
MMEDTSTPIMERRHPTCTSSFTSDTPVKMMMPEVQNFADGCKHDQDIMACTVDSGPDTLIFPGALQDLTLRLNGLCLELCQKLYVDTPASIETPKDVYRDPPGLNIVDVTAVLSKSVNADPDMTDSLPSFLGNDMHDTRPKQEQLWSRACPESEYLADSLRSIGPALCKRSMP